MNLHFNNPSTKASHSTRLVKDLKEGHNDLCQSLINITQFVDLNQFFVQKKNQFRISDKNVNSLTKNSKNSKRYLRLQKQSEVDLTPQQKIDLYRKQKIKEKYRLKYDKALLGDQIQKSFKLRKAKIPIMLNKFQEGLKVQQSLKFNEQIKKSEINLTFYRSQGKSSERYSLQNPQNQKIPQKSLSKLYKRQKFFSLQSGKPQNDQVMFPSFNQFVKGKNRAKLQQRYKFNLVKVQKQLDAFITQQKLSQSVPIVKSKKDNKIISQRQRRLSINQQNDYYLNYNGNKDRPFFALTQLNKKNQKIFIINKRKQRKPNINLNMNMNLSVKMDINDNLNASADDYIEQNQKNIILKSERSMRKSQTSSKQMIETMSRFLNTKSQSRRKYNNMVDFYHYDRPITNSIRRTQYKLDNQNNSKIEYFRKKSQQQRQTYLKRNSQVYKQILNMLSSFHEQDIPISLQMLSELRKFYINEYFLSQTNLAQIVQKVRKITGYEDISKLKKKTQSKTKQSQQYQQQQKLDFMIQKVLDILNKVYGLSFQWQQ